MINRRPHKILIECLLITGVIISTLSCCYAQENNQKVQAMTMENLIDRLLTASNDEYLDQEMKLRQGGAEAVLQLKARLNDNDVFIRTYARTMINWIEGRSPNNDAALTYLDQLPEKIAKTPRKTPSPIGTASYLSLHFQASVADILAVHLIKRPNLPYWRTAAILYYLEAQKTHEINGILLRFISDTPNDDFRDFTLKIIDAIKDPQLDLKILQEEKRLKSLNLSLPDSLKSRLSRF